MSKIIIPGNEPPIPRGVDRWVAWIYGIESDENRRVHKYTVWQIFEPLSLIERDYYPALAERELAGVPVRIWHFAKSLNPKELKELEAGRPRKGYLFCLEEKGGWKVNLYMLPRTDPRIMLNGMARFGIRKPRIFEAFKSSRKL